MCERVLDRHPSILKVYPDKCKTWEIRGKALNCKYPLVLKYIPGCFVISKMLKNLWKYYPW